MELPVTALIIRLISLMADNFYEVGPSHREMLAAMLRGCGELGSFAFVSSADKIEAPLHR